jgi:hypothetical protein
MFSIIGSEMMTALYRAFDVDVMKRCSLDRTQICAEEMTSILLSARPSTSSKAGFSNGF